MLAGNFRRCFKLDLEDRSRKAVCRQAHAPRGRNSLQHEGHVRQLPTIRALIRRHRPIPSSPAAHLMPESTHIPESTSPFAQIAARATKLYSRPTVAMEVVRLAEQPLVSAAALRQCIEQDPALMCKILRVVNSSLFGLSGRVGDLDQALSLLGIKPLKLLVLGFSLPDDLFAEVAARELRWYWTSTLTRAVAARLLSEQLWQKPGDEAFIAGLLEDIGVLVMLRELGRPYAKFLSGAIDERCDLNALERATLGFGHRQLTAMLLSRWHLPQKLVEAVSAPRELAALAKRPAPEGDLPRILHLAELLCQLVSQRRTQILPELLQTGREYRELTAARLAEIVRQLQPQVDQLAEALSLELEPGRDYSQVWREAHEQMGILAEEIVARADDRRADEDAYARLSEQTSGLTNAMQSFLTSNDPRQATPMVTLPAADEMIHAPHQPAPGQNPQAHFQNSSALVRKINAAAARCRQSRQELSLLLFDLCCPGELRRPNAESDKQLWDALDRACTPFDDGHVSLVALGDHRAAAVICNCERRTALATSQAVVRHLSFDASDSSAGHGIAQEVAISVGVATASIVPKNFDAARLIESAERCLNAARSCGISTVKSIEV
jgi:HD-like signal output (HDOD) protein